VPAISLADAETQLAAWLAASTAVASGQAYQIGNRSLKRADLKTIGEQIVYWNGMVLRLSLPGGRGGIRLRGATPNG
jgi:Family of unknown function (DUF6148)